ncbi:hypothetical protein Kisp01_72470 [Kineosporia sp. NBRC 101677]|uniref:hypothetical protein n=1 Tax=Kineosporia sp. NBRC 101677 TaxID=3032197 RepID=UPI0024A45135|nr:hypothetical protein [Kineosporia sp. NBRC 101677]GLY20233.1 hypothetical protein Kisp01_72470 [Kineosporia sp. NBRC 101677]
MARETFEMIDLIKLYEHCWAQRAQSQIAESLGIDRKTIQEYVAPAQAAVDSG